LVIPKTNIPKANPKENKIEIKISGGIKVLI